MRKLASIKTIAELHHIEGRDRIELAVIDGWNVIVKKDQFKVGDKCVYLSELRLTLQCSRGDLQ